MQLPSLKALPFFLFGIILAGLVFVSCDSSSSSKEYSFERSIQEPVIEKRCPANAPDTVKECYLLKWRVPVDTHNLVQVHVWIDTMVIDSSVESVSDEAKKKSIKRAFLKSTGNFDSLDISKALEPYKDRDDTVQVALWAEYSDNDSPGRIVRTFVLLGDDMPPARVQISAEVTHNTIVLQWTRPIDQTDFYRQDSIDGPIYGYNVHFWYEENMDGPRLDKASFKLSFGGKDISGELQSEKQWSLSSDTIAKNPANDRNYKERHFAIRDGLGFQGDSTDEFTLTISGIYSEFRYFVSIETYDIAGNYSESETKNVQTTDSVPPLQARKFWMRIDTLDPGRVAVDSNRVFLYWVRPVDPLMPSSGIQMTDDSLKFPSGCQEGRCYRDVKTYAVETKVNGKWTPIRDIDVEYPVWNLKNGVMSVSPTGKYVGDTLKWMAPGDTVMVRMRVLDSSGAYSGWLEDTLYLSRGRNAGLGCPSGFNAVNRRTGGDTALPKAFCVERFEHRDSAGGFLSNTLYGDARLGCQALSKTYPKFKFDLCSEDEWLGACLARNSSYGTVQEFPFEPQGFLYSECNQGTGNDSAAFNVNLRSPKCTSADGVRDLPGQLQEWARAIRKTIDTLKNGKLDTLIDTIGILKGSSYVSFETVDKTVLARCSAIGTPVRLRPKYTTDTVFLYQNGTGMDTLEKRDTTKKLYSVLPPSKFRDEIRLYEVLHPKTHELLGHDYFSQEEYDRRGGLAFLDAMANGLDYKFIGKDTVLLLNGSVSSPDARLFYREKSVGYRCCAVPNP